MHGNINHTETLIMRDFTGEVRFADEGRALTIDVLKTSQLAMATKEEVHITIAYHENQTFPDHITEITMDWINNLHAGQNNRQP